MTPTNQPTTSRKVLRVLGWLLAVSPAVVILCLLLPLRVSVPFEDSWAYVHQYEQWWEGTYGWRQFFTPHVNHPSAVGKSIYFVVLHWMDGDVALLPILSWLFSAVISAAVTLMARPLWKGRPFHGAMLLFMANLTIFTAAQGHAWVWDFIFQNFVPGTSFCAAMALLWWRPGSAAALAGAAVCCVMATFSFGTGLLAGLLLTPMIWEHFRHASPLQKGLVTAGWLVLMAAAAWTALKGFGEAMSTGDGSRVGTLLEMPVMVTHFVLVLLGYSLGNGTTLEPGVLCAAMGAGLVLVFLVTAWRLWQLRREPGVFAATLPWLLLTLYGLGNATIISYGRLRSSLISAMAPRYVTFTLFFALGVLLLAAAVAAHDTAGGWFRRAARRGGPWLLGAFIAMHAINWNHGYQQMKWEHERMKQDRAMLSFAKVLPLDPEVMWNLYHPKKTAPLALFLERMGKLNVRMVESTDLKDYRTGSPLPDKWAWLDAPVVQDGMIHLKGTCGVSKNMVSLPDLVVISARVADGAENIISFATPRQPFDFYENEWLRRLYPAHYFGWERSLPVERFPKGRVTVRAYGYWLKGKTVRALDQEHAIDL